MFAFFRRFFVRDCVTQSDFEIDPIITCLRETRQEPRAFLLRLVGKEITLDSTLMSVRRLTARNACVRFSLDDERACEILLALRESRNRLGKISVNGVKYEIGGFYLHLLSNCLNVYFRCPKHRPENNGIPYDVEK